MMGNKIVTKWHLYASSVGFLETKILYFSISANFSLIGCSKPIKEFSDTHFMLPHARM